MEKRLVDAKEAAVKEKRHWVRLTRACNNGCLFCLDSQSQDGSIVPADEVLASIRTGRDRGCQRLVLSGGEPTIHPDYPGFLRAGRESGYEWIQTITNGRMFAYRRFAERALREGLREATFSMHGHTPDLHDRLVGVPGAFAQSLAGMRNLLGRVVVNVDVVLNKLNIPVLREILEFYMALGINEFDLLHMVPFGSGWSQHRETLFYDPAEMKPHLDAAFALRRRPGIILWTNRLPAPFLEGFEDLIQDPHKIHDEVNGRREMFEAWRDDSVRPRCEGDRCGFCSMERYCQEFGRYIEAVSLRPHMDIHVHGRQLELFKRFRMQGRVTPETFVELAVGAPADLAGWESIGVLSSNGVCLELTGRYQEIPIGPIPGLHSIRLQRLGETEATVSACREWIERGIGVDLPAERALSRVVSGLSPAERARIHLHWEPRAYASESAELDMPPLEFEVLAQGFRGRVHGAPPCLGGDLNPILSSRLDLTVLSEEGHLDLELFTEWFIANRYHVRSLRCETCSCVSCCEGFHINAVRSFGFSVLVPLRRGCDG